MAWWHTSTKKRFQTWVHFRSDPFYHCAIQTTTTTTWAVWSVHGRRSAVCLAFAFFSERRQSSREAFDRQPAAESLVDVVNATHTLTLAIAAGHPRVGEHRTCARPLSRRGTHRESDELLG